MKKLLNKKKKGFTLLELVIVISIIAILITMAALSYRGTNLRAQAAAHNSNVKTIKNAAVLYLIDNPESTSITVSDLKDYLEDADKIKPANGSGADSFSINVTEGKITVSPGLVKVENNKIVSDNNTGK